MENVELGAQKKLELISQMISSARNKFADDGFHLMLWGWLIILSCIVQFIMIEYVAMPTQSNWVWLLMPIIGTPISIWYGYTKSKEAKVESYIDSFYKFIWIGFFISIAATVFVSVKFGHSPTAFIMILMGLMVFIAGVILSFKYLIAGSIIFWIGAILLAFNPNDALQLLIFALSVLGGYIIPGMLLRRAYKKSNHV